MLRGVDYAIVCPSWFKAGNYYVGSTRICADGAKKISH